MVLGIYSWYVRMMRTRAMGAQATAQGATRAWMVCYQRTARLDDVHY